MPLSKTKKLRIPVTKSNWNKKTIVACMLPPIILYAVFGIYPSLMTFIYSFTNMSRVLSEPWQFVGLENYAEFFLKRNYRDTYEALLRTVIYAAAVTAIQNGIAMLIAVLLNNKKVKGRNFFRAIIFLPVILGVTISCYAWSLFFSMDGPASVILKLFGSFSSFLGDKTLAFPIVIFIQIWMGMGISLVLFLAGLQAIPNELPEAAHIDGAGPVKSFWGVTFPLLWPTITVNVLLSLMGSLGSVQIILLTTSGQNNTSTLASKILAEAFQLGKDSEVYFGTVRTYGQQGYACALCMILFALILAATVTTQLYMRKGEKV